MAKYLLVFKVQVKDPSGKPIESSYESNIECNPEGLTGKISQKKEQILEDLSRNEELEDFTEWSVSLTQILPL